MTYAAKMDTIWQISVETEANNTIIVNVPKVWICILFSSLEYMRQLLFEVTSLPITQRLFPILLLLLLTDLTFFNKFLSCFQHSCLQLMTISYQGPEHGKQLKTGIDDVGDHSGSAAFLNSFVRSSIINACVYSFIHSFHTSILYHL